MSWLTQRVVSSSHASLGLLLFALLFATGSCTPPSDLDDPSLRPPAATTTELGIALPESTPPTTPPEADPEPPAPPTPVETEPVAVEEPVEPMSPEPDPAEVAPVQRPEKEELDFGEPLIEGLGKQLDPVQPVWLTEDRKSVVVQSMVCQRRAPLEMFACLLNSKEHESVLTVPVKAFVIHAGLLATGAKQGTPVRWDPEYTPPTGTPIEITLFWKDENGDVQKARAQEWVLDASTGQAMTHDWVFAGSRMYPNEERGKPDYLADSTGDLICVSNFSSAMLDVPVRSSDSNAALLFEAFTERIPELATPVTMVLTPRLEPDVEEEPAAVEAAPAEE